MAEADPGRESLFAKRLESALAQGALPGEREGFDEAAARDAADFMAKAAMIRKPGAPVVIIEGKSERAGEKPAAKPMRKIGRAHV